MSGVKGIVSEPTIDPMLIMDIVVEVVKENFDEVSRHSQLREDHEELKHNLTSRYVIDSKDRYTPVALCRQLGAYFIRHNVYIYKTFKTKTVKCPITVSMIGDFLGYKEHSCVVTQSNKVEGLIKFNKHLRAVFEKIENEVGCLLVLQELGKELGGASRFGWIKTEEDVMAAYIEDNKKDFDMFCELIQRIKNNQ